MQPREPTLPRELAAALEDLRHIRAAVDTARANHPMRLVARPLLSYSVATGLIVAAFGVAAQLLLDRGGDSLLGMPPETLVWSLGALLLLLLWIAKLAVLDAASRRAGYDVTVVLRATLTPEYLKIMLPGALTLALGSVGLHTVGGDAMILGFVAAGFGALVIPLGATIALPEWSVFGTLLFVLGAIAMFALPQWPFYTLALSWGGAMIVGGLVLRPRFPALAR